MSIKSILNTFLTTSAGFFIGFQGMTYFQNYESNPVSRTIASSTIHKMGADQILKDYLDIQLSTETIAEKNSDKAIVVAHIKALYDLPSSIQYKWQLSESMKSDDELSAQIPALEKNQSYDIKISVSGFSKEVKSHINFVIMGTIGGHNVRRSLILSSRPEDSLEYIVQQAARAEEKNDSSNTKNQKVKSLNLKKKFDPAKVIK